jgi:hypothetical protein
MLARRPHPQRHGRNLLALDLRFSRVETPEAKYAGRGCNGSDFLCAELGPHASVLLRSAYELQHGKAHLLFVIQYRVPVLHPISGGFAVRPWQQELYHCRR